MTANVLPRQASTQQPPRHGPYPSKNASLGGLPTVDLDVPITVVFMVLFILGAIANMTIFQMNKKKGHKFIMSAMMFGFCMARIVSCIMRIAWASRPTNIRIAIAAQIFVAAGVVLLFVINLVFTQRILRAVHPHSAWHPAFSWLFKSLYIIIVITLIMVITSVVQSAYTLNTNTLRIDRDIQLYGSTYYSIVSFLPIPMILGGLVVLPRKTKVEKFGSGRFRSKIGVLLVASALLCLGAAFRCGTTYMSPRPRDDPAWYQSKACFYIFNFTVEILVIFLYLFVRVDRRFWVPNGSRAAGDYSRQEGTEKAASETSGESRIEDAILPEEEVFDDMSAAEFENQTKNKPMDLEAAK